MGIIANIFKPIKQIMIVSKVTNDMVMKPKKTFDELKKAVEDADKSGLLKQLDGVKDSEE